ncbi:15078_t:CDS:2, partial [Funneliformis geosporum]
LWALRLDPSANFWAFQLDLRYKLDPKCNVAGSKLIFGLFG